MKSSPMFTIEQKKIIALSSLGGALEFYDFVVFIFMAKLLGELFFPATNPLASLMASLAVFAIGYLARPFGGVLFGHFGDRFGRKKTFVATVVLMAIPTFLIGALPTYHTVGIFASVLLVILRLFQGLSVGGEIPGAVVFIAESVPTGRRGLATGLILFGINMGMLAGSFVNACINHILTASQLMSWGWRIPFFIGGLLGFISYYLRKQLQETPAFSLLIKEGAQITLPLKEIFTKYLSPLLQGLAITSLEAVIVSITLLFFPTYLATFFHFPLEKLLTLNTFNIMIFSLPVLLTSFWSDQIGRKKVIVIGILFFCTLIYPLYTLFFHHNFYLVIMVAAICSLFASCVAGVFPCMNTELFPTQVRYSGVALTYNFGFGILGGLTPLLATELIHWSGNPVAPSWILMFIAMIALIAWCFARETYRVSLSAEG